MTVFYYFFLRVFRQVLLDSKPAFNNTGYPIFFLPANGTVAGEDAFFATDLTQDSDRDLFAIG